LNSHLNRRLVAVAAASTLTLGAAWITNGSATGVTIPTTVVSAAVDPTNSAGVASYAPIVSKVAPAVVTVRSERRRTRGFGGGGGGLGSGVIVNSSGYIVTNHHVINGADTVEVDLKDRRSFPARVVGSDEASDLAVLKVEAANLPAVAFGNSEVVNVGDVVLAFGNPLGVGQTVTMGIISAKGRATGLGDGSFEDFLQTDAPINSGNSGGALVNTRGELVGINSQILSPSGGNIGIGFSIPANMVRAVTDALVKDGRVHRGRLGVTVQQVTSDVARGLDLKQIGGALINNVEPNGPADRAGIKAGDVITALNGQTISDSNELRNKIAQLGPNARVDLTVVRDGRTQQTAATLEELPATRRAPAVPRRGRE
jgi:Do/DeqQ family serine protease